MARAQYFQSVVASAWLTVLAMGGCGDDATRQQGGDAGEQAGGAEPSAGASGSTSGGSKSQGGEPASGDAGSGATSSGGGGESTQAGASSVAGAPGGAGEGGDGAGGSGGDAGSGQAGQGGEGGEGGVGCILPTPFDSTPSNFPQVLECAAGLVDQQEHQLGGGEQYFKTDDDLRLGTCSQDACTTGGTHDYGLDLFFLPVDSDVDAIRVRGLPNDGMPATLSLRHYCTGEVIDTCTLDPGAQVYAECELDLPDGEPAAVGSYYSLDVSIDSCFFVFDTIELVDQGS